MSVVLLILLLVAVASATATYSSTKDHNGDHLATDVLNYQRQFTEDIILLLLVDAPVSAIEQPISDFERNMSALRFGGEAVLADGETIELDAAENPAIRETLDQIPEKWSIFRDDATEMTGLGDDHSERAMVAASLQQNTYPLIAALDLLVEGHNEQMEIDLNRLRLWQSIFLLSTIALLLYGIVIVRRRILRLSDLVGEYRLPELDQSVDLVTQEVYGDEVASLVESFELMRPVMNAAQQSLESRVLRRSRHLMTAFEYSQQIVSQVDKNKILRLTLTNAQNLVSAESLALCLIESDGCQLELSAIRGEVAVRIATPEGTSTSQPIQIRQIEPGASVVELCANCYFAEACSDHGTMQVALNADAKQIGSLCVSRDPGHPFDEDERHALQLLANSAAIAISNYRLADSSRFKEREEAISAERKHLTAVLHDNLAQTLGYLNLKADRAIQMAASSQSDEVLDELTSMKSVTGEAYDSVREMLTNLNRNGTGGQTPTLASIEAFTEDFRAQSGLDVSLISNKRAFARLTPTAQQQAYYIVRESLTNVRRHAQATTVTVQMRKQPDGLQLTIQDNGRGFDPAQKMEGTHLGLTIMKARANRCGGTLVVESKPNMGTLISAYLPDKEFETIYVN